MPNPATPDSLAAALGAQLKADVPEPFDGRVDVFFANGQRAFAIFGAPGDEVTVHAPLRGAHRGLPAPMILSLLRRNAADGGLAGGTVQVRTGAGELEISNTLPTALGAEALAAIMINQANAADELVATLRRDVAEWMATEQAEGR